MSAPLPAPWPGRDATRITSVRAVVTAPEGIPLVVVRVDTSEAGLYGWGCATFTQRWSAVVEVVEQHLAPLVVGRHPADITDIVRMCRLSAYWRDGAVSNNALSGIDMALWDIAGRRAGLPVHELIGGRVRGAVDTYLHAHGRTVDEAVDHAEQLVAQGLRHVRLQVSQPGLGAYGAPVLDASDPRAPYPGGWDVHEYLRIVPGLFERARDRLGDRVRLLHDVHSRLTPGQAVVLARRLEPFDPFFLEDVLPPELWDRLPEVRARTAVPLAVGELAVSVADAARLVTGGGIDFLRCHLSAVGGFGAAWRLAALAELHGVATAWHGPGDTSPVGVAAHIALDVASPAFGIQEGHVYDDAALEVFPGTIVATDGWMRPNETPGWGVDVDERAAARHPPSPSVHDRWAAANRAPDGGMNAP